MPHLKGSRLAVLASKAQYWKKVKETQAANLIAYWPLWEMAGTIANDISGGVRNGAYTAVALAQPGIGDGYPASSFNGAASFVGIYSAGLNGAFNNQEGTLAVWFKAANAGVWTDATERWIVSAGAAFNNVVYISKHTTANQLRVYYAAGGVWSGVNIDGVSSTGWNHIAITWSKSGNAVKVYLNGTQQGLTQAGLGVWAGALAATWCAVGAAGDPPSVLWSGNLAHAAIWNTVLSAAQIAGLAKVQRE